MKGKKRIYVTVYRNRHFPSSYNSKQMNEALVSLNRPGCGAHVVVSGLTCHASTLL